MRVRGTWYEHGKQPETDGMPIVDGFCRACFAEVMGAVIHVGPVAARATVQEASNAA
jgi:hypothetical protein